MFTTQGGIERHGEALLARIAAAIAMNEDTSAAEVKAAMQQEISVNLMRSVAKAISRRRRQRQVNGSAVRAADRFRRESEFLATDDVMLQ